MLIIIILGALTIAAVICSVIMISKRSNYFMYPLTSAAASFCCVICFNINYRNKIYI